MAEVTIISDNAPYYTILVKIGESAFKQTVYSELKDAELEKFLRSCADEYQDALLNPPPAEQ